MADNVLEPYTFSFGDAKSTSIGCSSRVWVSPTSILQRKWCLYRQTHCLQMQTLYIRLPCLLQLCWFWKVHSQWAIQTPKPKLQLRCAERTLPCLSYHARNRKLFSAISIAAFDWRRLSYRQIKPCRRAAKNATYFLLWNTKRTLPAYPRYVLPALQFPL